MAAVAGEGGGYAGASVARVLARSGVARSTFYGHFPNREACFLAAYREALDSLRLGVAAALASGCPAPQRLRRALGAVLSSVAANPVGGRLVLIEAFGASPRVRREHEREIADIEAALEDCLDEAAAEGLCLQVPAQALLGAVAGVASASLLERRHQSLERLAEGLWGWIVSYRLFPRGRRLGSSGWGGLRCESPLRPPSPASVSRLPRGRSALPADLAAARRHQRIVEATAAVVAERGYAAARIDEIAAVAKVSRGAFYSHFAGKQDAYLAAQAAGLRDSIAAAAAEFAVARPWPERVWQGLAALLSYLGTHPSLARAGLVEDHAAGEEAIRRTKENSLTYTLFLAEGYQQRPRGPGLPQLCSPAIAAANYHLMRRQAEEGKAERMDELLPRCAYLALAPFLGPEAAMRFVDQRRSGASREP